MNVALNNFVGNNLGCAVVAQHMLNIADEQQILVLFPLFQKMIWFIGVQATVHEIIAIKISKKMLT